MITRITPLNFRNDNYKKESIPTARLKSALNVQNDKVTFKGSGVNIISNVKNLFAAKELEHADLSRFPKLDKENCKLFSKILEKFEELKLKNIIEKCESYTTIQNRSHLNTYLTQKEHRISLINPVTEISFTQKDGKLEFKYIACRENRYLGKLEINNANPDDVIISSLHINYLKKNSRWMTNNADLINDILKNNMKIFLGIEKY